MDKTKNKIKKIKYPKIRKKFIRNRPLIEVYDGKKPDSPNIIKKGKKPIKKMIIPDIIEYSITNLYDMII